MRNYFGPVFLILSTIFLLSCDDLTKTVLPDATGRPGTIMVVMDSLYWAGDPGESVRGTFAKAQEGLPQREPLFNLNNTGNKNFGRVFKTMKNLLIVDIAGNKKKSVAITRDVWSEGQLIISITAPSKNAATKILEENSVTLLNHFKDEEVSRLKKKFAVNRKSKKALEIEKKFKFNIPLDENYSKAHEEDNLLWYRKDKAAGNNDISYGILIYTYPYVSDSTFEVKELVEQRNNFTKYVEGPYEDTYMISHPEFMPSEREINLDNRYVKELRGLWKMQNFFMGGPYVNYTMIDDSQERVVSIDCYLYAPNFDKREMVRELEALALSIEFKK